MTRMFRRPGRATKALTCFRCRRRPPDAIVAHLNLSKASYSAERPDGKPTMRGAGSIDLCSECWALAVVESRIRRRPRREAVAP